MDPTADLGRALNATPDDRSSQLATVWEAIDPGDHAARCIAAHYIADTQLELRDEVSWDELSLAESAHLTDADLQAIHPTLSVHGFMPSLHLNLADGYRRQGRFAAAAEQLGRSRGFDFAFDDAPPEQEAYVRGIREAQQRVGQMIAAGDLN